MRSKKPRPPVPPTLLHRTLVSPVGRTGPRPEASRSAHALRSHSPRYGGVSGPPWTTPKGQPASIMSTRAPATALRREAICLPVFELVAEAPQKSAHHQHQRGPAEGGCVLHGGPTRAERARGGENTRAVRGLASGFYLRCPPVGAAPRIYIHI